MTTPVALAMIQALIPPRLKAVEEALVYSSDLRRPEIARELDSFRKAWRKGETIELQSLRSRVVPAEAWWERLTSDPSSLTSAASRPRP